MFTAEAVPSLVRHTGQSHHGTFPRLAAPAGRQRPDQRLAIDLGATSRLSRIDDMALDPRLLQHPMDPEAIETSLLNHNHIEELPRSAGRPSQTVRLSVR